MRVLMLSKAMVVAAYRCKAERIGATPGIEFTCLVPTAWGGQALEPAPTPGYELLVRPIRFNGRFHLFHYRGLREVFDSVKPDLVHIDEEPWDTVTMLAARQAQRTGAKFLFFSWQNLLRAYPPPFAWFEQFVYRRASHAIAGNVDAASVLAQRGWRGPTSVLPQFGVDAEAFSPDRSVEIGRPFTVGYAGRLVEQKGLRVLLEAAARVEGDWRLRLVGDGPLKAEIESRVASGPLAGRVNVEPPLPSREMPRFFRSIDCLVLPSLTRRNWKEQFGRVLVEAMSCEVPVIGSDSGEIPRVIGDAGLVVREGDAAALAAAISELQNRPDRRAVLSTIGRERVLREFTHEHIVARTVEIYRSVLG
jgi:glycosyltransferase involved in cell wall biosynthesis